MCSTTPQADAFGGVWVQCLYTGKVLKDYPRERTVITLKWGPEMTRDGQMLPMDLSPQNCKCATFLHRGQGQETEVLNTAMTVIDHFESLNKLGCSSMFQRTQPEERGSQTLFASTTHVVALFIVSCAPISKGLFLQLSAVYMQSNRPHRLSACTRCAYNYFDMSSCSDDAGSAWLNLARCWALTTSTS